MNEPVLIGGLIAAILLAAVFQRLATLEGRLRVLSRIDGKLDALLKHQGIQFDPCGDIPPPVADALRRGEKILAIKEYRAATGKGLREAKEFVEEIQRRSLTGI